MNSFTKSTIDNIMKTLPIEIIKVIMTYDERSHIKKIPKGDARYAMLRKKIERHPICTIKSSPYSYLTRVHILIDGDETERRIQILTCPNKKAVHFQLSVTNRTPGENRERTLRNNYEYI